MLRERAIALRLEGKSLREIKQILGPMSNSRPKPANCVDKDSTTARSRLACASPRAPSLCGFATCPFPERLSYEECRKRAADGVHRYWEIERQVRGNQRASEVAAAVAEVGELTDREILIAGAIAYWCEGAKRKPGRAIDREMFINSDPALITFFLRFLDIAGLSREDLILRVYIHENADASAAQQYWLDLTRTQRDQFRRPVLKHHNPKTVRTNVGEDYHGCLRIDVRQSAHLYRRIEGWMSAVAASCALGDA